MDDRQFRLWASVLEGRRSRRAALKSALGIGAGVAAGGILHDADAARRGYAGPNASVGTGIVVAILEGDVPGTIEYRIVPSTSVGGRAVVFYNGTRSDLELELLPPDASALQQTLRSDASLLIRIQHPGVVRFRAWHPGEQPGEFREVDFPE